MQGIKLAVDNNSHGIMAEGATTGGAEAPVGEAAMTMPKPRGYQKEMLAESLRQNIVVAVCKFPNSLEKVLLANELTGV